MTLRSCGRCSKAEGCRVRSASWGWESTSWGSAFQAVLIFFHFISPSTSKPAGSSRHQDLWQLHFLSLLPRAVTRVRQVRCPEHKTGGDSSTFRATPSVLCLKGTGHLPDPSPSPVSSTPSVLISLPACEFFLWKYQPLDYT